MRRRAARVRGPARSISLPDPPPMAPAGRTPPGRRAAWPAARRVRRRALMATSAPPTTCPVCPCRDAEQLAGRDALLAEVEALWAFRLRRLRPAVPIAGLVDRLVFTQPPPHAVLRCCACVTRRRWPSECGIVVACVRAALCAC